QARIRLRKCGRIVTCPKKNAVWRRMHRKNTGCISCTKSARAFLGEICNAHLRRGEVRSYGWQRLQPMVKRVPLWLSEVWASPLRVVPCRVWKQISLVVPAPPVRSAILQAQETRSWNRLHWLRQPLQRSYPPRRVEHAVPSGE